jgi:tetratricopeptide (TPR) repeat protein
LGRVGDDTEAVAVRVRASAVHAELVGALDDWASITKDQGRRRWLLAVARAGDRHPLRNRLRQPELWRDGARLTRLAAEVDVAEMSPQLATALARVLGKSGGNDLALLTRAQARFPTDFWLNFELAETLGAAGRSDEGLGCYRAAMALRPDAVPVHDHLGLALRAKGRLDEAIVHFQQALRLNPKYALCHVSLGDALQSKGRLDEAIDHFQEAVRLDPNWPAAHVWLGAALYNKGRLDEAIDHWKQALRVTPYKTNAALHGNLGDALRAKGRLDEAIDHYQQAIRLNPKMAWVHNNLGACLYAAARAAARDAADPGRQGAPLGEPERARRRQALDRLRAGLALRAQRLQGGQPVPWWLTTWQTDPALASVRDPAPLAKLPAAERRQWQRLWADVAALVAADPLEQGRAHAARGGWARAAACYARAWKAGPTDDGPFCFEYAAVRLLAGDRPGYARACAHLVERWGKARDLRAYHMARACTLAPDAVADAAQPGRLAQQELQAYAREFWSLTERGALHYRAGRFKQAVPLFERSLRADRKPGRAVLNWLWLALAQHRLGKADEARRWLGKAQAWLDRYGAGMPADAEAKLGLDLHNWLEAHVLRREAEALLGAETAKPKKPGAAGVPKK